MQEAIKWHEKEIFDYTNIQIERIKAQKECMSCDILLEHIEIYQHIIHNLLIENRILLEDIKDDIII